MRRHLSLNSVEGGCPTIHSNLAQDVDVQTRPFADIQRRDVHCPSHLSQLPPLTVLEYTRTTTQARVSSRILLASLIRVLNLARRACETVYTNAGRDKIRTVRMRDCRVNGTVLEA